jgi:hypothetical protein
VPSRDEWERNLPRFRGEEWEVPAEHLLDFHDFIHRLEIVHEDVQIKIFRYSLEGIALEWCRSLPNASVSSLTDFHSAFNSFCKDYFPVECLFEGCCEEFSSFHKVFACHKDQVCDKVFIVEEDIYHVGQEVLKDDSDVSDIISDVSVVLNIDKNQHVSFGCIDVKEPMHISAGKRNESESVGESNRSTYFRSVENTMSNPQLSDLQPQGNCSRHEDLKGDEQIDQSTSEIIEYAVEDEGSP